MLYRNAKQTDALGSIDCEIDHPDYGWIPYSLNPSDTDMSVNNDDLIAAMNAAGDVAGYVAPTKAELDAISAVSVRFSRDSKLSDADVAVSNPIRWAAMSPKKQAEWSKYRQLLLDVPEQSGFPGTVVWPKEVTAD
jgi:hypothetical protein|tara:strand:+ start:1302 stop:1709 length:408 start_codon:yes stop_codon:yes gene_type:complete